jgi:hypothetical protein
MYQAIKEIIKKSEKKLFVVFIFLLRERENSKNIVLKAFISKGIRPFM